MLKKLAKIVFPGFVFALWRYVRFEIFDGYATKSYSQEGEDLMLMKVFGDKPKGFYVDVGAHHPRRFSNTYLFYKRGWSGINIDARPGSMKAFRKKRPRDINIEKPISEIPGVLHYYMFNEPALNGFSKHLSEQRDGLKNYRIEAVVELETVRLDKLLDEYLPLGTAIDFLSIDVEGLDFEVVRSLNLQKYSPSFILVEVLGSSLSDLVESDISRYLHDYGYSIYAKAVNTVVFRKQTPPPSENVAG